MYALELTEQDVETIAHVGYRYGWSDALSHLEEGINNIPEHEAWEIKGAFDSDTEGGHQFFPMLASCSDLCTKLVKFYMEIV